jgi:hypothetical protein
MRLRMASASALVELAQAQLGDEYVWGAVAPTWDPDPERWDCSEIVRWCAARLHVAPRVPDGSWNQYAHCHRAGLSLAPARALLVRGALLFRFSGGDPLAGRRPERAHVAISLGRGRVVEAASPRDGVRVDLAAWLKPWTHAGLLPGVRYAPAPWDSDPPSLPELRRGQRGPKVRLLQHLLDHGLAEDGDFGPLTEAEVRSRREGLGLPPGGRCDVALWRALLWGGARG